MIDAVLFDLDDTLFDQADWLDGAWRGVCRRAERFGVDGESLLDALRAVASEGSGRGRIVDRALALVGAEHVPVPPLVEAFRGHRPPRLEPWPGVRAALAAVRARVPVGLVTDGDVAIQRSKLRALDLEAAFDVVVFSDDLGRERRKPHPAPLLAALHRLGVVAAAAVYVGDRPDKDVAAAHAAGMLAVRVRTGEYRRLPDDPVPWRRATDIPAAVLELSPHLARRRSA